MKSLYRFVGITIATLALLSIVDSTIVGRFFVPKEIYVPEIHILPPNTEAIYQTNEFRYTVHTNALGNRGVNVAIKKPDHTIRILTIGDSYTYGWGVNDTETWPSQLATQLYRRTKQKVEVINLGFAGASPDNYLETARHYIPLYQPDIVLLGFLEADDIAQILGEPSTRSTGQSAQTKNEQKIIDTTIASLAADQQHDQTISAIQRFLQFLVPNSYDYISRNKTVNVTGLWRRQVADDLHGLDDVGMERFLRVSDPVKKQFIAGRLSPGLLWLVLNDPDHYIKILQQDNTYLPRAYEHLKTILHEINMLSQAQHATLAIVDIPHEAYVDPYYLTFLRQIGLHTLDSSPVSNVPITAIQALIGQSTIQFIPNLTYLRKTCKRDCYFLWDTHMNAKAHRLIAQNVTEYLQRAGMVPN